MIGFSIELFVLAWTEALLALDSNTWNHLTVCKQMRFDSFKSKVT